jgi:phosphoribosylaminoimidazole-succinocarboxamide synthase
MGAGSTDTSLWTHYKAGAREYCGNAFPDGMKKNDRLDVNVITPTTKVRLGLLLCGCLLNQPLF